MAATDSVCLYLKIQLKGEMLLKKQQVLHAEPRAGGGDNEEIQCESLLPSLSMVSFTEPWSGECSAHQWHCSHTLLQENDAGPGRAEEERREAAVKDSKLQCLPVALQLLLVFPATGHCHFKVLSHFTQVSRVMPL